MVLGKAGTGAVQESWAENAWVFSSSMAVSVPGGHFQSLGRKELIGLA